MNNKNFVAPNPYFASSLCIWRQLDIALCDFGILRSLQEEAWQASDCKYIWSYCQLANRPPANSLLQFTEIMADILISAITSLWYNECTPSKIKLTCPELASNITFYILTIIIYIYFIIHFTILIDASRMSIRSCLQRERK